MDIVPWSTIQNWFVPNEPTLVCNYTYEFTDSNGNALSNELYATDTFEGLNVGTGLYVTQAGATSQSVDARVMVKDSQGTEYKKYFKITVNKGNVCCTGSTSNTENNVLTFGYDGDDTTSTSPYHDLTTTSTIASDTNVYPN
jgi:hypothetical protein